MPYINIIPQIGLILSSTLLNNVYRHAESFLSLIGYLLAWIAVIFIKETNPFMHGIPELSSVFFNKGKRGPWPLEIFLS